MATAEGARPGPNREFDSAPLIASLLSAIDAYPAGAPALLAYQSAIRRQGQDLAAIGGGAAMDAALAQIAAADPERAAARETVITTAWAGLPVVLDGA